MNERLPYEEQIKQSLADLPLPGENMGWADMKRRLEEDDDDRIIPFWLRGCALWGLLVLVLLGLGWWWFSYYKRSTTKEEIQKAGQTSQQKTGSKRKNDTLQLNNTETVNSPNENTEATRKSKNTDAADPYPDKESRPDVLTGNKPAAERKQGANAGGQAEINVIDAGIIKNKRKAPNPSRTAKEKRNRSNNETEKIQSLNKDNIIITGEQGQIKSIINDGRDTMNNDEEDIVRADSISKLKVNINNPDTSFKALKDPITKKDTLTTLAGNKVKKDSAKQKSVSFSAGIALHQLLPLSGQKFTPYNSLGRKGSLADYIPSIYFRMYRNDKWFLQSEFRYGAPQYTREIVYFQKSVQDTQNTNRTTTSSKLKKTFYHQLPVSFNYFVLPNWSIGSGFVWNRFSAAVSEQDVVKRTLATGSDTIISQGVVLNNRKADSNFVKSYFQATFETQYKYKRFSLGARYSFGLQPYLKFTLPGGTQQQEKNSSLQVFLRYELWESKKRIK
jgi:hypothetical protein